MPRQLGESFRFSETIAADVSEPTLRKLVANGKLEKVARGLTGGRALDDLDQVEIARKGPLATICLSSALVHHDLSDDSPAVTDVALPRGTWHPQVSAPVRWHSFALATFELAFFRPSPPTLGSAVVRRLSLP